MSVYIPDDPRRQKEIGKGLVVPKVSSPISTVPSVSAHLRLSSITVRLAHRRKSSQQ